MHLMVVFLRKEEYTEEILSLMVELGVTEAVTLNVHALGKVLANEIPIFAGLRVDLGEDNKYHKLILALVDDELIAEKIVDLLKDMGVDFEQPGLGRIFTLPVSHMWGPPLVDIL